MTDQQPGWGQQPHGPQPPTGYAPPPKKKSSVGKTIAIVLGSIVGFFILVGACSAALDSGGDSSDSDKPAASAPKESGPKGGEKEEKKEELATESPVKIEAKKTEFTPSILHSGGKFTSVQITVTNNSDQNVDVNPLAFAITDTGGTKHPTDALGEDENQIDTVTLAPGENVTGVVTAEGAFKPATVTFTENIISGEPIKADVK